MIWLIAAGMAAAVAGAVVGFAWITQPSRPAAATQATGRVGGLVVPGAPLLG